MSELQLRYQTLADFNANESEIQELLSYNQNVFQHNSLQSSFSFPLGPEPHIADWEQYTAEADRLGAYTILKSRLVQLQFPVVAGISETDDYRTATRKGTDPETLKLATGLILTQPEKLQLKIHNTLAGPIPVIITGNREDFVLLIQSLTKRSEPITIPDSMGACIIGGYNNWDRIRAYRKQWGIKNPEHCSEADWNIEFKRLIPQKELYQDRFIVLSPGFYSNISAKQLGLTDNGWQQLSLTIRLEHECTHYFTRRVFGSMRNNLLDELIADYRGIVAATGQYRSDWFLHFIGLESFPDYRQGGRLENYRGDPPLTEGAFKILQALVKTASENLEGFDQKYVKQTRTFMDNISILIALTTLTLEELASSSASSLLEEAVSLQQQRLKID
jgi:hypothetical protein